jgi:hypothetical protein
VGFEKVDGNKTEVQLRLVGRVPKEHMPTWRIACERLNLLAGGAWTIDISQQYFVPEALGKLVRDGTEPANGLHLRSAWRIIIAAKDGGLDAQLATVAEHLSRVQPARVELATVPLNVAPERNVLKRGKGAQPVNTAVVGPALLAGRGGRGG